MASAVAVVFAGRPVLAALQLAPPLVLLNTPMPCVPAYRVLGVCGSIAKTVIIPPSWVGPLLVHWSRPAWATFTRPVSRLMTRVACINLWVHRLFVRIAYSFYPHFLGKAARHISGGLIESNMQGEDRPLGLYGGCRVFSQ